MNKGEATQRRSLLSKGLKQLERIEDRAGTNPEVEALLKAILVKVKDEAVSKDHRR